VPEGRLHTWARTLGLPKAAGHLGGPGVVTVLKKLEAPEEGCSSRMNPVFRQLGMGYKSDPDVLTDQQFCKEASTQRGCCCSVPSALRRGNLARLVLETAPLP
jgi:hypothetical protein